MAEQRSRTYAFLLYPESAPENWRKILSDLHVPCAISPVHDADLDDNNLLKKSHYHGVLYFDQPKACKQVIDLLKPLNITYVEQVSNTRSYNRYLCHLDNPEKAQYSRDDIETFSGAVVDLSLPLTPEQRAAIRGDILAWCRDFDIVEYSDLVDYAALEMPDWMDYVESHTIFLNGYIRSRRCSSYDQAGRDKDET